jgi:hypothetical protein
MEPSVTPEGGTGATAAVRAAERWADFTKALSIYPDTNVRVRSNLAALRDALAAAEPTTRAQPDAGVEILFRGDELSCGGGVHPLNEGTNLGWLRTRLDKATLAGVVFQPRVEEDTLLAFSKKLLEVYLHQKAFPSFEELWPEPFDGLALIDRRFEGGFGGSVGLESGRGASERGSGRSSGGARRGGRRGATSRDDVVKLLMTDGEIAREIAQLDADTTDADVGTDTETVSAGALLDRIVSHMPAEALEDPGGLALATRDVLRALRGSSGGAAARGEEDDSKLAALMQSVSRSHFARGGPDLTRWARDRAPSEEDIGRRGAGRRGDDGITDDVTDLLIELDALPAADEDRLRHHGELRGEELAVCLYYLMHMDDPTQLAGLYRTLEHLLAEAGPEELGVLRACVQTDQREGGPTRATPAILAYLHGARRMSLLRAAGVFTPGWIVRVFPSYFVAYLNSITGDTEADLEELSSVCTSLGTERMLYASSALATDARLLDAEATRHLLAHPDPARLPLARMLLDWQGTDAAPAVGAFLRKLGPDLPESFPLYMFDDLSLVTVEYLLALTDHQFGRTPIEDVRAAIAGLLCRHVRAMRVGDPMGRDRIESIRRLASYPTPEARRLLADLARGGWNPFGVREPASIRRVARHAMRSLKAA